MTRARELGVPSPLTPPRVLGFDFTRQSGLNVGEQWLLTVTNETGQTVGKAAGKSSNLRRVYGLHQGDRRSPKRHGAAHLPRRRARGRPGRVRRTHDGAEVVDPFRRGVHSRSLPRRQARERGVQQLSRPLLPVDDRAAARRRGDARLALREEDRRTLAGRHPQRLVCPSQAQGVLHLG
eukprot:475437-Prymnesium_polylepis.1